MACGRDGFFPGSPAGGAGVGSDTGFGTGGSCCHLSAIPAVSDSRNGLLLFQDLAAGGAFFAFCQSRFGTGRRDAFYDLFHMSIWIDRFIFCLSTSGTGISLHTGFGTGRFGGYGTSVPAVAGGCDGLFSCFPTGRTGVCLHAFFRTGGWSCYGSFVPAVPGGRNRLLFFEYFSADRTFAASCQSIFCAGRRYNRNDFFRMTGSRDGFCLCFAAGRAGIHFYPIFCTGRIDGHHTFIPAVAGGRDFFHP